MAGAVSTPTVLATGVQLPRIQEEARRIFHAIKTRDHANQRQLTRIHDRHREIARLVALGMTDKEISEQVGVKPEWVGTVRNTDVVAEHLQSLREERDEKLLAARTAMEDAAAEVAEFLRDTALDTDLHPKYRLQAAESILDRVGLGKSSKTESHSVVEHHTTIENIRRLAANAAPNPNIKPLEVLFEAVQPLTEVGGKSEARTPSAIATAAATPSAVSAAISANAAPAAASVDANAAPAPPLHSAGIASAAVAESVLAALEASEAELQDEEREALGDGASKAGEVTVVNSYPPHQTNTPIPNAPKELASATRQI